MSNIDSKYEVLFSPLKIGKTEIKNRFFMAGMGGNDEVSSEGACAQNAADYYVERAKGGFGVVCTGTMTILNRPKYKSVEVLLTEDMDPETFVRSFEAMNERIHAYGAKSMIQLSLGTSPSKIKGVFSPSIIANDFTTDEMKYFVERYKTVSKYAKDAGFDIIEVHSLHTGYLLDQIVSEETNHRTDEYGGNFENRMRIMKEIREAIREACGNDYPVSVKLGATTTFYDCDLDEEDPSKRIKQLHRYLPESVEIAKYLEQVGYDMMVVDDVGTSGPFEDIRNYENVFKQIQDAVSIPVIGAARLNDPDISSDFIKDRALAGVSLGRQSFADPEYVNKLRRNKKCDIRFCLSCNQGCISRNMKELTVKCAINAVAGRESNSEFAPLRSKKKVMVVGGGPGGMEVARVAAARGHEVTIYERKDHFGGDFFPATEIPYQKWGRHYIHLLEKQMKENGVNIVMNKEITKADIDKEQPDVIITAAGADEFIPRVEGIDSEKVVLATDYIMNPGKHGEKIVVIGGGLTGCEIGLEDARDGKEVTIVEMQPSILGGGLDSLSRSGLVKCMEETDLTVLESTKLVAITEEGAVVENEEGRKTIPADTIVLAVGFRPRTSLFNELQNYAGEVYNIGNSKKVGNVSSVIWEAYELGNGI